MKYGGANPAGRVELFFTGILTLAALIVAGSVLSGTVAGPRSSAGSATDAVLLDNWSDGEAAGTLFAGDSSAPLTVIVLMDLECPACAAFSRSAHQALSGIEDSVRVLYVHYPLRYHRYALAAANAADCALRSGGPEGFARWVELLFLKQDSLGLKPWASYAAEAELPNPSAIEACAGDGVPLPQVQAGLDFGERIALRGTPTIIIEGWVLDGVPPPQDFRAAVEAVRSGRRPDRAPGTGIVRARVR